MSFWQTLAKPIIGMAPMDGVTDVAFREILSSIAKPSVIFTEFVHVQALWHGRFKVFDSLRFSLNQRPIVAQIFGSEPAYFYKAAHIIAELGFDGIDINMGCPANTIVRRGGGAQLIQTPKLAQEIIRQTKRGVYDWQNGQTLSQLDLSQDKIKLIEKMKIPKNSNDLSIPVSVKTRIGINSNTINSWSDHILECKPEALTVHGRTLKQLYHGNADWEAITSISNKVRQTGVIYLGNGDVKDYADAISKSQAYDLDGVLIGRSALGNPWVFKPNYDVSVKTKLATLLDHARIFTQYNKPVLFPALKKHLAWYCSGFDQAKKLRLDLMACQNYLDVENTILDFESK